MIRMLLLLTAVLFSYAEVLGQPADSLYWVVETNIRHPNYTIVHFYNYRNVKVHEVRMHGVYIDIRNPKQRKKLDLLMKQFYDRAVTSSKRRKTKNTI
jgi:hypothetical protein